MSGESARALSVPCPTCYAPAGARWRVQQGGIVSYWYGAPRYFHAARARAAESVEKEKANG